MGVFIAVGTVQIFLRSAGMVDFIKVHTVAETETGGKQISFIKQFRVIRGVLRRYDIAGFIGENKFQKRCIFIIQMKQKDTVPGGELHLIPGVYTAG